MQEVAPNPRYTALASEASLETAAQNLTENGMTAHIVESAADARRLALELMPDGAEVFTAASKTLEEIGLLDAIENSTRLRSVRATLKEMDMATQWTKCGRSERAPTSSSAASRPSRSRVRWWQRPPAAASLGLTSGVQAR
jgi:hypothetical protein